MPEMDKVRKCTCGPKPPPGRQFIATAMSYNIDNFSPAGQPIRQCTVRQPTSRQWWDINKQTNQRTPSSYPGLVL